MVPSRFEPIRDGRIELVGRGYYGAGGKKSYGMQWADSTWKVRWTWPQAAYYIWPALTPLDHQMLVWKALPPVDSAYHYFCYMLTADVVGDSVTPPDTIVRMDANTLTYSGTSWGRRRWVVMQDGQQIPARPLRIYRSDSVGHWEQMRTPGLDALQGMRAVALDSTNVLVVTSEAAADLRWAMLRDTSWIVDPAPLTPPLQGRLAPRLGWLANGVLRMVWASYADYVCRRDYRGGGWTPADTLRAEFPEPGFQYLFYDAQLSAERSQTPAIAWDGYGLGNDNAYYIWCAFPTDSGGYEVGHVVPGSWEDANPTLVRDENEDVWLAWWRYSTSEGIFWTHSYTTATSSAPIADEESGRPRLRWTLSESAPGTWWGVMRSVGGAPAERVARVRATPALTMSWADSSAPAGASIRYAIRRECRDVRYQQTSASAEWRPRDARIALTRRSANPASDAIELELSGASAGTVEVVLYDIQGRSVVSQRSSTAGSGVDALRVPFAPSLRSGLYFLRVRGSDGRESRPLKVAVLR